MINVFNVDRLVSNLCTIWVDRSKFYANIARFHRAPLNNNKVSTEQKFGYNRNINNVRAKEGVTTGSSKSYVHAAESYGWRLKAFPLNYDLKILLNGLPLCGESYWTLMIRKRKVFLIRAKEVPGWVPEFVDDSDDDDDESDNGFKDGDAKVQDGGSCEDYIDEVEVSKTVFEESLEQKEMQSKDPFGFTPNSVNNEFCMHEENVRSVNEANSLNCNMEENQNGQERNNTNKGSKEEI
nr:glucose-methanol-choline oxidoreductase, FAD/NAD(P)-binding domain protein [Tanacetum cinerariifolium]